MRTRAKPALNRTAARPRSTDVREREEVGVILVHGIGEQRRFQHLDWQLRELIRALQRLHHDKKIDDFSVDVAPSAAAAFHAEQDTWTAGPEASVDIVVRHKLHGQPKETHLKIHEVWWADVNEPYSLAKQLRFWLWGLAIWWHPGQISGRGPSVGSVRSVSDRLSKFNRIQLFLVGVFFVLVGYSVGMVSVVITRLFNLRVPRVLRVLANYISAVKLYSQDHRFGTGVRRQEDFLDSVGLPPRVSIRRRMMRAIADVALQPYARWYILAHSQGSVVAFNGLMDTTHIWPAYLDEERWQRLKNRPHAPLAGSRGTEVLAHPAQESFPPRPVWVQPGEIVFRELVFERFRGLLTYGAPLAKFAGLWPGVVPVSLEPAFKDGVPWLNLHDPIDPVSGLLGETFKSSDPALCPSPIDIGYGAGPLLLAAHLEYLTPRNVPMDAASATIHWLLADCTGGFPAGLPKPKDCQLDNTELDGGACKWRSGIWFTHEKPIWRFRRNVAWATWLVAALALALLGAWVLPILLKAGAAAIAATWSELRHFAPHLGAGAGDLIEHRFARMYDAVGQFEANFSVRVLTLAIAAVLLTLVVGGVARLRWWWLQK